MHLYAYKISGNSVVMNHRLGVVVRCPHTFGRIVYETDWQSSPYVHYRPVMDT